MAVSGYAALLMTNSKLQPNLSKRFFAAFFDYGIFYIVTFWYTYQFGSLDFEGSYSVHGLKTLPIIIFWFIYFPVIESFNGFTLGKKLFGLRVIRDDGHLGVDFSRTFKRHILDFFEVLSFGIIALITVKHSKTHQRAGDMWAGSRVIGGEKCICLECFTSLNLSHNETLKGEFECPNCGQQNKLD